jgi:hypothetical protein
VRYRLDFVALAASALSFAITVLYLYLVATEHGTPTWWALVLLVIGAAGSGYAVRMSAPYRRLALSVSGLCLLALGYVALFSIGMPLLLAGALCVSAALRARPVKDWRDLV